MLPRRHAADAVAGIFAGRSTLSDALAVEPGALSPEDESLARAIIRTTARRRGDLEWVLSRMMTRKLPARAAAVKAVMATAAAQVLFMRQADHAAVDCAVDLLKGAPATAGFTRLANAVLRRVVRERDELLSSLPIDANTPTLLWDRWRAAYGESVAAGIAAAHREEPALDLAFLPDVLPDLASSTDAALLPTGGLRLPSRKVEAIDGFEEGRWWVQDFAAQLPVTLLGDVKGKRVADLCAAPGGKTMQLAAAGAEVVAVEENEERARLIAENLARTRLADRVEVVVADARTLTGTFDAVLLDAPCSATGTLRRHPEVAYNKRAEDFGALAALQRTLLSHAATLLAPGGRLVFATCSLEPEEGERHLDGVLPEGLRLDPLREDDGVAFAFRTEAGAMRTRPDQPIPGPGGLVGLDGFFAARFVKV